MRLAWIGLAILVPALAWADAPNPSFYLVNRSDQAINAFFASPVNARTWGDDRLGDDTVDPGGNAAIRLLADGTCNFDLRVVYDNGRTEERRNVNTCRSDNISFNGQAARAPVAGDAPNRAPSDRDPSFRLVNRGPMDIAELYVRPAGSTNWGRRPPGGRHAERGRRHGDPNGAWPMRL